ncbi:MAG: hypothetical protein ABSF83_12210 [Nitrososphaerales archaeon]|jgi:hypothetical protein
MTVVAAFVPETALAVSLAAAAAARSPTPIRRVVSGAGTMVRVWRCSPSSLVLGTLLTRRLGTAPE